eukprot:scaffold3753_cov257-Pinguiococcus_pyrenoidosus.AAC.5
MFLSGLLENPEVTVAASAVATTTQAVYLMAWIGFLVAASVRVGQAIGAGDVKAAKLSAKVALGLTAFAAAWTGSILFIFSDQVAAFYSNDEEVKALGSQVVKLMAPLVAIDAINNTVGGIMSGLGKQRESAMAQVIGYYAFGMPLGIYLTFSETGLGGSQLGVFGLWGGIGVSMLASLSIQILFLLRFDWREALKDARTRLGERKHAVEGGKGTVEPGTAEDLAALLAEEAPDDAVEDARLGKSTL